MLSILGYSFFVSLFAEQRPEPLQKLGIKIKKMGHLIGIIIGLVTFFLFPIIEWLGKRGFSQNEGNPELWYLPKYGFRLVIRNLPRKVKLFDLKYKSRIRSILPPSAGSSVSTLKEETLVNAEDFFLLPGYDQVILSFQLKRIDNEPYLIHTNKVGEEQRKYSLDGIDYLVCDYTAHIDNRFHFDVFVGRRVEIKKNELNEYLSLIEKDNREQPMNLKKIIKVG